LYVVRERQGRTLAIVAACCPGEARARTATTLSQLLGTTSNPSLLKASWCRRARLEDLPVFQEDFFASASHGLPRLAGDK
jgi:hypothetical protein